MQEKNDRFVTLADAATEQFSLATAPGGFLVNLAPARQLVHFHVFSQLTRHPVRHLPDWLPGTGFKETARSWASTLSEMVEGPHNFVKEQMVVIMSFSVLHPLTSLRPRELLNHPLHRAFCRTKKSAQRESLRLSGQQHLFILGVQIQ